MVLAQATGDSASVTPYNLGFGVRLPGGPGPVPEPSTFALAASSGLSLVGVIRLRVRA